MDKNLQMHLEGDFDMSENKIDKLEDIKNIALLDAIKEMKDKKTKKRLIILAGVCIVFVAFFLFENKHLVVNNYEFKTEKIAEDMDGFKLVQISDLHNATFGKNNKKLLAKIRNEQPDIIVITGDLVDSNHTNIKVALQFAEAANKICPVYYVTGNHEKWLSIEEQNELYTGLRKCGVTILDNECEIISKGNASFCLIGLDDKHLMDDTLKNLLTGHEDELSVVLAHEPQYIQDYANANADLVLTGHAHGGQFRLPFIGGVVAPDQGFNPKYTAGEYDYENTTMIVSRGLGNSVIPVRMFNYPEVVCIDLKKR